MPSNSNNILITGGTFNLHHLAPDDSGIDLLLKHSTPAAFHNSNHLCDKPPCHPNTRVIILADIMDWVIGQVGLSAFILWLYGPAGSGKTAIGRNIAKQCQDQGRLLASFLFSKSDKNRSNLHSFVATLAYQVAAIYFPPSRNLIETAVKNDPAIFMQSLQTQFTVLIIKPLQSLVRSGSFNEKTSPCILVIDGLDECQESVRCTVLDLISISTSQLPLRFLISSRSEPDILMAFSSPMLDANTYRLRLDNSYQNNLDIEQFLRDEFETIKANHPFKHFIPTDWPTHRAIHTLVKKASGQFIYAATVVKYVKAIRRKPTDQLEVILGLHPASNRHDTPFAELDALYRDILSAVEEIDVVLMLLGIILLSQKLEGDPTMFNSWVTIPLPCLLEQFRFLEQGDVHCYLIDLGSILECRASEIQMFHASFRDYLFDSGRSREYHIDPGVIYEELAITCLKWLGNNRQTGFIQYSARNLVYYCLNAHPTERLRQQIVLTNVVKAFVDWGFDMLLPNFISFLKSSKFSEPSELYWSYLWKLDEVLHTRLNNFPSKLFITTGAVCTDPDFNPDFLPGNVSYTAKKIFQKKAFFGVHHSRFDFYLPHSLVESDKIHPEDSAYQNMLYEFFTNPIRAGPFMLDGTKYAEVAILFLKHISAPFCVVQPDELFAALVALETLFQKSSYSEDLVAITTEDICLSPWDESRSHLVDYIHQRLMGQIKKVKEAIVGYLVRIKKDPIPDIHITLRAHQWETPHSFFTSLARALKTPIQTPTVPVGSITHLAPYYYPSYSPYIIEPST